MPQGANLSDGGHSLLQGFLPLWHVLWTGALPLAFCLLPCWCPRGKFSNTRPGEKRDLLHSSPTGENQIFGAWGRVHCLQRKIKNSLLTISEAFIHPALTRKTVFLLCYRHRKSPNSSIPFEFVNWSLQIPNWAADHDVLHGSAVPGKTEALSWAGSGLSSAWCFQGLGLCWFPVLVPPGAYAVCASCQGAVLHPGFSERDMSCCPHGQDTSGGGWSRLHHVQPWPLATLGKMAPCELLVFWPCGPCSSWGKLGLSVPAFCFQLCCLSSLCYQTHYLLSAAPFSCHFHPPSPLPISPPPFSCLTLESLFLLLCSSKTISIKVIDDEEYEKNKTFYLEIGEPRLVEMSEKKGGGCSPGLSPACVSLSGSLMPGTCNTELTSPMPMVKGRSEDISHAPWTQPFHSPPRSNPSWVMGMLLPLPICPRVDVQLLPPIQPSPAPRHPGGRELHACVMPTMCLPLSCVPTGNSLPLEYLTVRSMRKSAVSSLCLGTRCGYDEEWKVWE